MALGQQLSNLAKKSKEDEMRRASKSSGKGKAAALGLAAGAAGAAMASRYGRRQGHGLGNSKTRVESSDDDSDWEDASDDESSSTTSDSDGAVSAADSELAYGTVAESLRPAAGVAAAAASAGAAAAMAGSHSHSGYHSSSDYRRYGYGYNGERSSIVDPRLFGPYNSLRGSINTPCGFRDEEQAAAYRRSSGSVASGPIHMRDNYPGLSAEQSRFQSEQTSHSASRQDLSHQVRPAPVPLQQPVPKVPVSSKVYETEKFEESSRRESSRRESRNSRQQSDGKWGDIAVEAAAVGAVGAAVAYTASRKESKERRESREDKRDHDSRRGRDEKRETELKRQERIEEESFERERERLEFERQKALEAEQLKLQELERQKAQEIERQKALELERQRTQELERQKTLELERQLAQQAERHKELEIERQRNLEWEREYRRTHHDSSYSHYNERKHEKSSRYDDHDDTHKVTKEKEVEKEERSKVDVVVAPQLDRSEGKEFRIEHGSEFQVMREPEVQAESSERTTTVTEESRELPLPTGAGHHVVTEHEVVAETSQPAQPRDPAYDPFQYQVSDDAFTMSQAATPKRPLTPNVVTIEREPNFDDSPPRSPDARLSRRDSFEIERMVEEYRRGTQDVMQFQDPRSGHGYEEEEHEAKSILDEAKHATIPVAAVAVASAVAVERGRQSSKHAKDSSRDSSRQERDTVQEEADRYYRETNIARKIASEEMRSRSASPERSVIDKWQDDKCEPITIVTPPDMEEKHPETSPFDGPNADVKIDNKIYPREERHYRNLGDNSMALVLRSREVSRERPVLNLIYPTPAPSRQPSPAPEEKETTREIEAVSVTPKAKEVTEVTQVTPEATEIAPEAREVTSEVKEVTSEDVIVAPRGDIFPLGEPAPLAKSVTWGENETKSFEVETPETRSDTESYFHSEPLDRTSDKPRPRLNKASRWGILAAAIAGSSAEPINEPEVEIPSHKAADIPRSYPEETSREVVPVFSTQVYDDDSSREPPIPGPKPASPHPEQMPGGYADDLEFAATLAAGLKETGFDPEIVIDNPTFHRRDSSPGVQKAIGDAHGDAHVDTKGNWYSRPYAETASDTSDAPGKLLPEQQGFILGEVETPKEDNPVPFVGKPEITTKSPEPEKSDLPRAEDVPLPDDDAEFSKLSKRQQRKRAKSEVVVVQDDNKAETTPTEPAQPREVGEAVWEDSAWKRGKKGWKSREFEDESVSRVSPPADYHHDKPSQEEPARDVKSDDGWDTAQDERQSRDFDAADVARVAAPAFAIGAWSAYHNQSSRDAEPRQAGYQDPWDPSTRPADWANPEAGEAGEWAASQGSSPSRTYHRSLSRDAVPRDAPSQDIRSRDDLETPKKSRKQWKDEDYYYEDDRSRVSAPSRSHRRHTSRDVSSRDVRSDDEWEDSKRSRRHKKERDAYYEDDLSRISAPLELPDSRSSRRRSSRDRSRDRSKDRSRDRSRHRSKHRSKDRSRDRSRHRRSDDERDTPRSRRSKRDSYGHDSPSRSVVASEISVGSSGGRRSKKSKRRSGNEEDWYDYRDSPPDRRREHFDDRDVSSVVSESRGDRRESGHRRKSSRYDDDDVKSVASMPGSSRRDKDYRERRDPEKRSSGIISSLFKSNRKDKRDSFLDNAGTLGAGVGLAGAATVIAASDAAHSNAAEAPSDQEHDSLREGRRVRSYEILDPEVAPRVFKPAIDPQYGDLLPLPPSEPGSPVSGPDELPSLPDSRPDTPPEERVIRRDTRTHNRRRSTFETPTKSPSRTAVPIQLRLGQRSNPASPVGLKSSPSGSPVVINSEPAQVMSRRVARPTSWDSTREIMPLYLLEHSRQAPPTTGLALPALPPSEPSEAGSRHSPSPEAEFHQRGDYFDLDSAQFFDPALHIDTNVPQAARKNSSTGTDESTTPRALFHPELPVPDFTESLDREAPLESSVKAPSLPTTPQPVPVESTSKDMGAELLAMTPSPREPVFPVAPETQSVTPEDLTSTDEHFSDATEAQSPRGTVSKAFDDVSSVGTVEEIPFKGPSQPEVESAPQPVVESPQVTPTTEPAAVPVEELSTKEPAIAERAAPLEPAAEDVSRSVDAPGIELPIEKAEVPEPISQDRSITIEPIADDVPNPFQEPTPELPIDQADLVYEQPIVLLEPIPEEPADFAEEPTPVPFTEKTRGLEDVIEASTTEERAAILEPIPEEPEKPTEVSSSDSPTEKLQDAQPAAILEPKDGDVSKPTEEPISEVAAEKAEEKVPDFVSLLAGETVEPIVAASMIEESPRELEPVSKEVADLVLEDVTKPEGTPEVVKESTGDISREIQPNLADMTARTITPDAVVEPQPEPAIEATAEPTSVTVEPLEQPEVEDKSREAKMESIGDDVAKPVATALIPDAIVEPSVAFAPEAAAELPPVAEDRPTEPVVEDLAEPAAAAETVIEPTTEPAAEPVPESTEAAAELVAEAPAEPSTQAAPQRAENEFTTEEWQNLSAKDRKNMKKKLKKKNLELIVKDSFEVAAPVEEAAKDEKAERSEETTAKDEPLETTSAATEGEKASESSEQPTADISALPAKVQAEAEPESTEKELPKVTEPEESQPKPADEVPTAEHELSREPEPAVEQVSDNLPVEKEIAQEPEPVPEPEASVPEAVVEAKPPTLEEPAESSAVNAEAVVEEPAQPQSKKSKKKKKKGKQVAEEQSTPAEPETTVQETDKEAFDAWAEPIAPIEPSPDAPAKPSDAPVERSLEEAVEPASTSVEPTSDAPTKLSDAPIEALPEAPAERSLEEVVEPTVAPIEPTPDTHAQPSATPAETLPEAPVERSLEEVVESTVATVEPTPATPAEPSDAPAEAVPEAPVERSLEEVTEPTAVPVETAQEPVAEPTLDVDAFDAWAQPDAPVETVDTVESKPETPAVTFEATPEPSTEAIPEETPSKSKKKKNKKKKGTKSEDAAPSATQEASTPEQPLSVSEEKTEQSAEADTAKDLPSDSPAPVDTAEPESTEAPTQEAGSADPTEAPQPETSLEGETEKKPEENASSSAAEPPADNARQLVGPEDLPNPTEAPKSQDVDEPTYLPSSMGLHAPQKPTQEQSEKRYFPSTLGVSPATRGFAAIGSTWRKMWGSPAQVKNESQSIELEADRVDKTVDDEREPVVAEAASSQEEKPVDVAEPETAVVAENVAEKAETVTEKAQTGEVKPDTPPAEPDLNAPVDDAAPTTLESHISEPLFSQGDAPVEESQTTTIGPEPSQVDDTTPATEAVSRDIPAQDEPTPAPQEESVKIAENEPSTTTDNDAIKPDQDDTVKPLEAEPVETSEEPTAKRPVEEPMATSEDVVGQTTVAAEPQPTDEATRSTDAPEAVEPESPVSKKKAKKNKKKKKNQASQEEEVKNEATQGDATTNPEEENKNETALEETKANQEEEVKNEPAEDEVKTQEEQAKLSTKEEAAQDDTPANQEEAKNETAESELKTEEEVKREVEDVTARSESESKDEPRVDEAISGPTEPSVETNVAETVETPALQPTEEAIPDTPKETLAEEKSPQPEVTEETSGDKQVEEPTPEQPADAPLDLGDKPSVDESQPQPASEAEPATKEAEVKEAEAAKEAEAVKEAKEAADKAAREAEEAEEAREAEEMATLREKRARRKGRLLKKDQQRLIALEESVTRRAEARAAREAEEQVAKELAETAAAEAAIAEPVAQEPTEAEGVAPSETKEVQDVDAPVDESQANKEPEVTEQRPGETSTEDVPKDITETTEVVQPEAPAEAPTEALTEALAEAPASDKAEGVEGDVVNAPSALEPQDVPAEDDVAESVSGKKSKNKKKKKSVTFETDAAQDAPQDSTEPSSIGQEPLVQEPEQLEEPTASKEESSPTEEPTPSLPVEETLTPSAETEQPEAPAQATSVEEPAQAESADAQAETAKDTAVDEAEAPAEKKSKKKKKKKKNASSDDSEKQSEADSLPQETPELAAQENAATTEEPTPRDVTSEEPKDAVLPEASLEASDSLEHGGGEPVEALFPTDEAAPLLEPEEIDVVSEVVPQNDEQTQPADVENPVETPSVQEPPTDVQATEVPDAPAADQPPAEEPAPTTEEPEAASPAKLSKKEKKKKKKAEKKKAALEEAEPDSGLATPSEDPEPVPEPEATDPPAETLPDPREDTPAEPEKTEISSAEAAPEGEPATPADDTNVPDSTESGEQSVPSEEPAAGPEDERGGSSLKQSRTDEKNKAKDNHFEILQDPETNRPTEPEPEPEKQHAADAAVDEARSLGPSENETREEDKSNAGDLEAHVEPEAKLEPEPGLETEKLEDNEGDAGLSKKQKKKQKQKAKALAASESSAEPETPKETEASPEEPTEPAVGTGIEPESKPEAENEPTADTSAEPDNDSGPKIENETLPDVEETVPIVEPDTEAESKPETETQPLVNPDAQSAVEPTTAEPELEADVLISKPESDQQTTSEQETIVPESEIESGKKQDQTESQPDTKVTAEQELANESTSEPLTLPTPAPIFDEPRDSVQPSESIVETEQQPVVRPELEALEKTAEDSAPSLSKKDKKKKKKAKSEDKPPEPPQEADSSKEVEPAQAADPQPVEASEPVVEPVAAAALQSTPPVAEAAPKSTTEPVIEHVTDDDAPASRGEQTKQGDETQSVIAALNAPEAASDDVKFTPDSAEPVPEVTQSTPEPLEEKPDTTHHAVEPAGSPVASRPSTPKAIEEAPLSTSTPTGTAEPTVEQHSETTQETPLEPEPLGAHEATSAPEVEASPANEAVPEAQAQLDKEGVDADEGLTKKEKKKNKKKKKKGKGTETDPSEDTESLVETAPISEPAAVETSEPHPTSESQPEPVQLEAEATPEAESATAVPTSSETETTELSGTHVAATEADSVVTEPEVGLESEPQEAQINEVPQPEGTPQPIDAPASETGASKSAHELQEQTQQVPEPGPEPVEVQQQPRDTAEELDQGLPLSTKAKKKEQKKGKEPALGAEEDLGTPRDALESTALPTEAIRPDSSEEVDASAQHVQLPDPTPVTEEVAVTGEEKQANLTDDGPSAEPTTPTEKVQMSEEIDAATFPEGIATTEPIAQPATVDKDEPSDQAQSSEPAVTTENGKPDEASQSTQLPEVEPELTSVPEASQQDVAGEVQEVRGEDPAPSTPKKNKKKKKKGKGKETSQDSEPTTEPTPIAEPIEPSLEPVAEPASEPTQPTMEPETIAQEQDKAVTGAIPATDLAQAPAEPQQVSPEMSPEPSKELDNVIEPVKSATETGSKPEASADVPSVETALEPVTGPIQDPISTHAPETSAPLLDAERQAGDEAQPPVLDVQDHSAPHVLDRSLRDEVETTPSTLAPAEAATAASSVLEPAIPEVEVVPAVERVVEPLAQPQEADDMSGLSKKEKKRRKKAAKDLAAKLAESQLTTSDTLISELTQAGSAQDATREAETVTTVGSDSLRGAEPTPQKEADNETQPSTQAQNEDPLELVSEAIPVTESTTQATTQAPPEQEAYPKSPTEQAPREVSEPLTAEAVTQATSSEPSTQAEEATRAQTEAVSEAVAADILQPESSQVQGPVDVHRTQTEASIEPDQQNEPSSKKSKKKKKNKKSTLDATESSEPSGETAQSAAPELEQDAQVPTVTTAPEDKSGMESTRLDRSQPPEPSEEPPQTADEPVQTEKYDEGFHRDLILEPVGPAEPEVPARSSEGFREPHHDLEGEPTSTLHPVTTLEETSPSSRDILANLDPTQPEPAQQEPGDKEQGTEVITPSKKDKKKKKKAAKSSAPESPAPLEPTDAVEGQPSVAGPSLDQVDEQLKEPESAAPAHLKVEENAEYPDNIRADNHLGQEINKGDEAKLQEPSLEPPFDRSVEAPAQLSVEPATEGLVELPVERSVEPSNEDVAQDTAGPALSKKDKKKKKKGKVVDTQAESTSLPEPTTEALDNMAEPLAEDLTRAADEQPESPVLTADATKSTNLSEQDVAQTQELEAPTEKPTEASDLNEQLSTTRPESAPQTFAFNESPAMDADAPISGPTDALVPQAAPIEEPVPQGASVGDVTVEKKQPEVPVTQSPPADPQPLDGSLVEAVSSEQVSAVEPAIAQDPVATTSDESTKMSKKQKKKAQRLAREKELAERAVAAEESTIPEQQDAQPVPVKEEAPRPQEADTSAPKTEADTHSLPPVETPAEELIQPSDDVLMMPEAPASSAKPLIDDMSTVVASVTQDDQEKRGDPSDKTQAPAAEIETSAPETDKPTEKKPDADHPTQTADMAGPRALADTSVEQVPDDKAAPKKKSKKNKKTKTVLSEPRLEETPGTSSEPAPPVADDVRVKDMSQVEALQTSPRTETEQHMSDAPRGLASAAAILGEDSTKASTEEPVPRAPSVNLVESPPRQSILPPFSEQPLGSLLPLTPVVSAEEPPPSQKAESNESGAVVPISREMSLSPYSAAEAGRALDSKKKRRANRVPSSVLPFGLPQPTPEATPEPESPIAERLILLGDHTGSKLRGIDDTLWELGSSIEKHQPRNLTAMVKSRAPVEPSADTLPSSQDDVAVFHQELVQQEEREDKNRATSDLDFPGPHEGPVGSKDAENIVSPQLTKDSPSGEALSMGKPPKTPKTADKTPSQQAAKETKSTVADISAAAAAALGGIALLDKADKKRSKGKNKDENRQVYDEEDDDLLTREHRSKGKDIMLMNTKEEEAKEVKKRGDRRGEASRNVKDKEMEETVRDAAHDSKDKSKVKDKKPSHKSKDTEPSKESSTPIKPSKDKHTGRDEDKLKRSTPAKSKTPEPERGWKDTPRQGTHMDTLDMTESPILGRGDLLLSRTSSPQGLLRLGPDVGGPMSGLLREDSQPPTPVGDMGSEVSDLRRSPSRLLAPVKEVPESEIEPSKSNWKTPDAKRDSGLVGDAASFQSRSKRLSEEAQRDSGLGQETPTQRRSRRLSQEVHRDSGVHTGEPERTVLRTPEPRSERKLRRSPRGTPVLREPSTPGPTPEPEKKERKQYGALTPAGAAAAAVTAGAGLAALRGLSTPTPAPAPAPAPSPAPQAAPASSASVAGGQRSVSDNAPLSRQSTPGILEGSGRRAVSNTSLSRRRTPEPLKFRPESPGIRTSTPPLRRVDRRMSGDLRSLRQQNNTTPASSTPVANEGRARAKDMADVYVGILRTNC